MSVLWGGLPTGLQIPVSGPRAPPLSLPRSLLLLPLLWLWMWTMMTGPRPRQAKRRMIPGALRRRRRHLVVVMAGLLRHLTTLQPIGRMTAMAWLRSWSYLHTMSLLTVWIPRLFVKTGSSIFGSLTLNGWRAAPFLCSTVLMYVPTTGACVFRPSLSSGMTCQACMGLTALSTMPLPTKGRTPAGLARVAATVVATVVLMNPFIGMKNANRCDRSPR